MSGSKNLVSALVLLGVAGAVAYGAVVRDNWREPRVVSIVANDALYPMFPAYMTWLPVAKEGSARAMLLRPDDLVISDSDLYFRYRHEDGDAFELKTSSCCITLDGKMIALSLDSEEGLGWLAQVSDEQIALLRMIELPDDPGPTELAAMERIAGIVPDPDLLGESPAALSAALAYFRPTTAVAAFSEDEPPSLDLLKDLAGLETLYLDASSVKSLDFLTGLPKLRRLALAGWSAAKSGGIPPGLDRLRSLIVMADSKAETFAVDSLPAGLEELAIIDHDGPVGLGGIGRLANLRNLVLASDDSVESLDLTALSALPKLRWLGLWTPVSQGQLETIIDEHPRLRIVELAGFGAPLDLAPLRQLSGLSGLVLAGEYRNLGVLEELESLRYIGLSEDQLKAEPQAIEAIRKALPDAAVVEIARFCLGSAWIFLLLPALAFAGRRRRSRMPPAAAA